MTTRRDFLRYAAAVPSTAVIARYCAAAPQYDFPRITFYGATQQVSGSCHLLETSHGLYVVDCGMFTADIENFDRENREFPFNPKDVKALLLTHAHADHHGRLPLLYKQGFRGKIYCTDATRDLTQLVFSSAPPREDDIEPLFELEDAIKMLELLEVVPYNRKVKADKLTVRYTDAGHILGSAMIEVWVDGRKILFSGDTGPENGPILFPPTQHYTADAVLVESTYGPSARSTINYEDFGKRINEVIERGGDVLIPTFALHKSQMLIFTIQRLMQDGVVSQDIPIYCDSGTIHKTNLIYHAYQDYYDDEARNFVKKHGTLFYMGKYREGRVRDFVKAHGGTPSIYIATSGMLAFAASPQHLRAMADNPKNALFIPGYQAPNTVGRQLLDGIRDVTLNIQEVVEERTVNRQVRVNVELEVDRVSGFSSHATGEQILEWLSEFEAVGPTYIVHGDKDRSTGLAEKAREMGLDATAPERNESFTVKGERVKPGAVPPLDAKPPAPAIVDQ
ncbi:MAG TPA: MBL fold metallo-hydrolase [Pirellulaceae bacterium]|nr:MBL fold metallo-hydrolase [Pirellulaceae bacterium]HMO93682.1 MBL fold metallo-hydrolase [Pirellulaceae bacterium]HMP68424.1 MBL fold metallo-hydrolase [Pirellulaceae bacterium]